MTFPAKALLLSDLSDTGLFSFWLFICKEVYCCFNTCYFFFEEFSIFQKPLLHIIKFSNCGAQSHCQLCIFLLLSNGICPNAKDCNRRSKNAYSSSHPTTNKSACCG